MKRCIAVALATAGLAVAATPAAAATHDYCWWDGSYAYLAAFTPCFQSGENYLGNNHAYLPYQPVNPTIYCGANQNGSQYAGYTSGNPSCDHAYSGANLLKAKLYVSVAATTHGDIAW